MVVTQIIAAQQLAHLEAVQMVVTQIIAAQQLAHLEAVQMVVTQIIAAQLEVAPSGSGGSDSSKNDGRSI
jgi:hypothetical protein